MIACAATHIVLVALLVVLTAVAATQKSVTARKKKQAKMPVKVMTTSRRLSENSGERQYVCRLRCSRKRIWASCERT